LFRSWCPLIDPTAFIIQDDKCSGQTIAALETCTVQVKFSPTSAGSKVAALTIFSNDPDENPLNVILSGTGVSDVTCSFAPVGTRLIRGGTLRFWATASNDMDEVQTFHFATNIELPNGNRYPSSGWLLGPIPVALGPHTSKSKYLTQYIPYNAPCGTYTYRGYVGKISPPPLYNECQFNFTVEQ
jgi:hypothetical protein